MNRLRKIVIGIIGCFFTVSILLFAAILIAPKVVDTKTVKAKVRSEIKKIAGVEIDFKHLGLDFFPHPHVIIGRVTLAIPPAVKGKAESVRVHPKILPLFLGKVQVASLGLDSAELDYTLTKKSATQKPASQPFSLYELGKKIQSIASTLPEIKMPNLDFQVNHARVRLFDDDRKLLELTEVNSHLEGPPAGRQITVNCTSNLWQSISINGLLDTNTFESSGQIRLTQFQPQRLSGYLFPDSALQLVDAPADLTIDFKTDGPGHLQAQANGSAAHLKFHHAKEELSIKNAGIKAEIQVDKDSTTLSLAELVLEYPQLKLSAHLTLSQKNPALNLKINGTQIDVASTRQTALALLRKNEVVKDIFDIVKGGSVPLITLKAQGDSLSDLGNTDNMVIRGQMHNGEITIPDMQFDLKDASGEVVISRGILEGENLRARLGNSWGQNGRLRLGLTGEVAPFHLETDVRADLSQLPAILKRLVDDKDVQKELKLLESLKGSANGKLVLGEDTENVKVKVEASDIQLSAGYRRIPLPVEISGGNFSYEENRVGVRQLRGRLGKSSFAGLSGNVDLGQKHSLEIESGKSRIFLAEILTWLSSAKEMRSVQKYHGGGKSIITLSEVNVKGPLFSPPKWHFNLSGEVEDLVLKNLPGYPGPLTIASGKFKVAPQNLSYTDAQMKMQDAVVKISGVHHRYLEGFEKNGNLTLAGQMGPQSIQWISSLMNLSSWIKLRPLTLSTSHLKWDTREKMTLSGNLAIQEGVKISSDILVNSDELIIKKLSVRDQASRATIGLNVKGGVFDVSFNGNLHKSTLDRLLQGNNILAGSIDGNIKAHIDPQHLSRISLQGELKGQNVYVPVSPKTPLKVGAFSINGDHHKITIQSADLGWGDLRLGMSGSIRPGSQDKLRLDMDVSADAVALDHLIEALNNSNENKHPKTASTSPSLPVEGSIRFKADRFNLGKFTWNPLHADISLNNGTADITLKEAVICGIATPGTLKVSPQNIEFDLEAVAKDQELNPTRQCFVGQTFKADGTYNLKGRFQGRGKAEDLLKTVTGKVEFTAKDGHIYHDFILLNLLKFLNTIESLTGRVNIQHLETKGFGYHSFRVKAKLQGGKIVIDEAVLHGAPMTVTAAGAHNLQNGRIHLSLLVAPLVNLDRIFEHIPLIGGILDTLDTIPLNVKGALDKIHIYPLAPSAIGFELVEMMKKTVERPINLVHAGRRSETERNAAQ